MAAEEQVDLTGRNTALHRLVTLAWRLRNQPDDISCFQRGRVFGRYGHDLFVHASRRLLTVVLSAWWSTPVAFLFSCGIYEIRSISACIKAPVAMGAKMRFALSPFEQRFEESLRALPKAYLNFGPETLARQGFLWLLPLGTTWPWNQ